MYVWYAVLQSIIQFGTEKYYFRTKGKIPGENPNFSGQSKQFQVLQDMYEQSKDP